jgi:N-acyl-D-aspartate/D-glutamate deacylase
VSDLDLLVRGGTVFDGRGTPPVQADVGVRDGRVVAIAPALAARADRVVDARGCWVAPGFLDIHTHYDLEVEIAPALGESVRHGVTAVVMGHCSLSLTVGDPGTLADIFLRVESLPSVLVRKWLRQAVAWRTPAEYLAHLRRRPLGPSVAALLGHSALRAHVMGLPRSLADRATAADLAAMRRLAEESLAAGCIGISADMVPWHMMSGPFKGRTIPSQHAGAREYAMLADVCRAHDAVFQVTPNPQDLRSFLGLLRLALRGRRPPLRMTVLAALDPVVDRRLWRVFGPLLRLLDDRLGANVRFQTLTEPFTVYSDGPITPLFEEFPAGVRLNDADTPEERRALWASPAFRADFARDWTGYRRRTFHRDLALMRIVRCSDRSLVGRTFAEVADDWGRPPVEVFVELLAKHDTELRWEATGANDRLEPRLRLMADPHVLPGFTDAGAHARHLGFYDGALSLLRQALATRFLSPERAIQRVTGEPAAWFRLDTGVLRPGGRADLVLLRPQALRAPIPPQVEIEDPVLDGAPRMVKRGSDGAVRAVYVAGRLAWGDGRPGAALGRDRLGTVLTLSGTPPATTIGEPISAAIPEHPFTDYWEVFVLKHQHPANVASHVAGVVLFYGLCALAWAAGNPWWLALLPLSQLAGLAGHRLFEPSHVDRRDAVFSLRACRCLNRMFLRVITGRYAGDVRGLRARLAAWQRARAAAPPGDAAAPGTVAGDGTPAP